jgi:hypothetical protein
MLGGGHVFPEGGHVSYVPAEGVSVALVFVLLGMGDTRPYPSRKDKAAPTRRLL